MTNHSRFFASIKNYRCRCGNKVDVHGVCQECWRKRELKAVTKEFKQMQKEVKESKSEDLYYKKVRCG